jgi:hypothetical protein
MEAKAFPAFGYVLLRTKLKAGEVVNDEMMTNNLFSVDNPTPDATGSISGSSGAYIWMLLHGVHTYTDVATGKVDRHERGWCNLVRPLSVGMYEFAVIEDSEYICLSPRANHERTPVTPELEYFALESGESCELPQGTKLYLLDGALDVAGRDVPAMRQIHLASGRHKVTAKGSCLGYIFKV